MPQFLKLLSCDQARRELERFEPVGQESVPISRALGRVLPATFTAPHDLPLKARSVMDGYAVVAADTHGASDTTPTYLKVVGTVPMGGVLAERVEPGTAAVISTGGLVPEGADAVVMLEYVDSSRDGEIEVHRAVSQNQHLIRQGEDIAKGEIVVAAGRRLRPVDVGALAGFGSTQVKVFRQPRVAVLSTGNEIVPPQFEPKPGQIRDVNQYSLGAQAERAGAIVTYAGIVRDERQELAGRLEELMQHHDLIMLSGGSSVGTRDIAAEVVGALGEPGVMFHGINVRPGKPTLVASVGGKPVLGMPGFPVSSMVIFDVFVRPLIWRMGGELAREQWPARIPARFERRYASVAGREDWVRVRLEERHRETWAVPILGGSAAISSVLHADGYVRVESGQEGVEPGEPVEVLLLVAA